MPYNATTNLFTQLRMIYVPDDDEEGLFKPDLT